MNKKQNYETVVYTPESPILHPVRLLKTMLADMRASFRLAYRLTARDISATYRQTVLGYFWAVFPPLVTSLTFIILNRANIIAGGDSSIPYPVFVITGTIFWQLFVDALNAPLKVLNINRSMLSKINFPKEALILSAIGQVLFSFVIKAILLGIVLIVLQAAVKWTAVFLLLPIVGLLGIGILLGLFLVPIGMLYQDIQQGLVICTACLMFFTPVLFSPPKAGFLGGIVAINPLSPFLIVCREMLFSGDLTHLNATAAILGVTLVLMLVAWILYRITLPILIERMEA